MSKADSKLLTEVELELMNIIWQTNGATVKDVMAQLPKKRALAYTSVSTILRILEKKKILKSEKMGRGHFYKPLLKKENYGAKTLKHIVHHVFDGAPLGLVKTLLDSKNLSPEDIQEFKKILEEKAENESV